MSFQVKAEILLNNSNWEKNLRKTSKQLDGLGHSVHKMGELFKGAVELFAIKEIFDGIMEVTKAASLEHKSIAILDEQLTRHWKANEKVKKSVDEYLSSASATTGVMKTALIPAFTKIASVTTTSTKAFKFFGLAQDISAKYGKDLNITSMAMAKFLGGNKKALDKLVPGLSTAKDKVKFLTENIQGFAAVAGRNDPFSRLSAVMEDFKVKLGTAFLPVIQKFSDWLASPEAQKGLDEIAKKVQKFGEWFMSKDGQTTFKQWMNDLKVMITLAGQFLDLVGQVANLLGSSGKHRLGNNKQTINTTTGTVIKTVSSADRAGWNSLGKTIQNVVINAEIKSAASAKDVVTALQRYAQGKGIPMSKLLK